MASLSLTPRETRNLLKDLELRPSRKLGQNFLVDGNIVEKSLQLAGIQPGETAVEIGPGLGTLTRGLLGRGCRVHAVEKDVRLCRFLEETLQPLFPDRFHLLCGDAVAHPLAGLPGENTGPFKVVANLPYAISTPWLDAVLSASRLPEKMILMLQRETADRFSARAGGKHMGAITLFLQGAYDVERGHRVPRQCFYPVPDVDSFLMNLQRKAGPHLFSVTARALIRQCFGQRRKQVGALLRKFAPERDFSPWFDALAREGLGPRSRPEAIPLPCWQELDRLLEKQP